MTETAPVLENPTKTRYRKVPPTNETIQFIDENIPYNEKGRPWSLTGHHRRGLAYAYCPTKDGKLRYSIILWSEPKKSAKTFLAGCIATKEAITVPDSEIVCVANDAEQAESRVYRTVCQLIKYNPALAACAKVLSSEIRFTNGSIIRWVSSDYKGQAGGRQRLTIFDEIWAFDREAMQRLFEEMTPPPTEENAYILIVSYAGFTGESELLERFYQRGLAGKRIDKKLELYEADGLFMFWSHTPRQPWQTDKAGRKYYEEQRRILRPNTFMRLHENRWVSAESTFITPEQYDALIDRLRAPLLSGGNLYVGIDIGIKSDSTGVVGVSWEPDGKRLSLSTHRVWKPTKNQPVNLEDVFNHVVELCTRHHVSKIFADPYQAMSLIQRLQAQGLPVEEFPQTVPNCTKMGEELFSLISNKNLIVYPSPEMREHVTNAVAIETPRGIRLAKEKATKKIDLAVALSMACVAALQGGYLEYLNSPDLGITLGGGSRTDFGDIYSGTDAQPYAHLRHWTRDWPL